MIKLGFDAKRAFCNSTGLGNFSRDLIDSLIEYYPENEYHLFTSKKSIDYSPRAIIHRPGNFVHKLLKPWWRSSGLKQQIYQNKIQLFHGMSHEIPVGLDASVKTVVTMHDLIYLKRPAEFQYFDRMIYDKKFRYACTNADHIVAITEETKKDIMHFFGTNENKISVIYQSCHPVFAINQQSYQNTKPYLLFVGSLNPRKKPLELVKAFIKIANEIPHDLLLVGRGEQKNAIIQQITENNLQDRIRFISAETTEDLAKLYRGAELFIFPSVDEGFGIPIIEAMSSHTAVLTSPYSCLPEVAGEHSFYTEPDDIKQFAADIVKLINDKQALQKSETISQRWLQRYSRKSIAEQYMNLFENILRS